ncbi:transmembrane protein 164-like [Lineus longissimus]|uniref:transmembrane protein 164-like n=1 Tax=Lineus longissimus TaxID=88925 RepID=UPI00315D918D
MAGRDPIRSLSWYEIYEWTFKGVDHTLPGNGGPECVNFISLAQRITESVLMGILGLFEAYCALKRVKLPKTLKPESSDWVGRRVLLMMMCLTFGVELGFKFATKQLIYILNPCHLVSMIQIFLLSAPANQFTTFMFRLHMHMLNGAPLAMIFPVINTRLLPCETGVYYIQHVLILVIPYFLLRHGGVYTVEPLFDFNWCLLSSGLLFSYHFVPLHYLAFNTEVNLNNMLCPAISDPFYGKYYRIAAVCHQGLLLMIHGKIYTLLCSSVVPLRKNLFPSDDKSVAVTGDAQEQIEEVKAWELLCNLIKPSPESTAPSTENNHNATERHGASNNIDAKNNISENVNGHAKIH